jgi:hypothetical protein
MPKETAEQFANRIANLVDFKKFVAELHARDRETAEDVRGELLADLNTFSYDNSISAREMFGRIVERIAATPLDPARWGR